jgi:hypothetical protein
MKKKLLSVVLALCVLVPLAHGEEKPLLAIPGKLILDSRLDAVPAAPWKVAKGKWEPMDGALKGAELAEDHHGAVMRANEKLGDCIVEVEVMLEGARSTSLSMNAVKDHMARILITPGLVTVQKDDNDHEGPDKAQVFHRVKADLKPGVWMKVRMELVGDTMLGRVDNIIGWGTSELFTQAKASPGVTVAGEAVKFRNFKIWEATKNPEWDSIKATLANEVAPVAASKGKGKAKKKAK